MNQMLARRADGTVPAAKPLDDVERLQQLERFGILDSGKDPRFDRITRLTADLLDMPIAVVTLVAETREWFKSAVGVDIDEITRDEGFCSHALHLDGQAVLTVTDALLDARFATHPFVVSGPKLRFYSGAPLMTASGHKIGMLCVHDVRPRHDFGVDKERILSQLAAIAMDEIDFHRIETERAVLIGELSHRVKNVIAVVKSVASLSARGNASDEAFLVAFSGRLDAMLVSHDQLIKSDWKGACLHDIVASVAGSHQNIDKTNIRLDIPPLMVDPPMAQMLALVVHELVTNSLKYGALKVPAGQVTFKAVAEAGGNVNFVWRENGGPPPTAPEHAGFGHRLLNMAVRLKGGNIDFDWQPTGLVCRFLFVELALSTT
jgi:two-component sensor histidine kinase